MKKYYLLILIAFFFPQVAFMQTNVQEQLSVDFTPLFPGPDDLVVIDIESFSTDLNSSDILWYLNGTLEESGFGIKRFSFIMGELGEETTLDIIINKQNGESLSTTYSFFPGEVDLYYEPQTYTPPFYKGKPEYSYQSELRLVALPNFLDRSGKIISEQDISYEWKINGDVDQLNSGTGKNVYSYNSGIISRPVEVVLKASPINSDQVSRVVKVITPIAPSILIYEKNPIYGTIYEQNIRNDSQVDKEEIELVAEPYNFSENILDEGIFNWSLNNESINNFISNNIIFRRVDDRSSRNSVSVQIKHSEKMLQIQRNNFILNFGSDDNEFNF